MLKIGILICSCDYYSDCWEPLIYSFDKFWPDCEYPKFIVANHKQATLNNVTILNVGDHKGWAADTKKAVHMTDCDYFIYFQEDYFLNNKVNNEAIKQHIQHCIECDLDYLKLQPDFFNNDRNRIGDSDYTPNPITVKYRINTATAIWKRSLFDKVLRDGDTGWDFEYKITPWIKENNIEIKSEMLLTSLYKTKGIIMIPANAIQRGKWTLSGEKFLKENGFKEVLKGRKCQGKFYGWCYSLLPHKGILMYPSHAILKILKLLKLD